MYQPTLCMGPIQAASVCRLMEPHSLLWTQVCLLLGLALSRSMLSNKSETHFKGLCAGMCTYVHVALVCMCKYTSRLQQICLLEGTVDINLKLSVHTSQSGHLFRLQAVQTHNPDRLDKNRQLNIPHSPFKGLLQVNCFNHHTA